MENVAKEFGFTLALPPKDEFREYMADLFYRGVDYTESPSFLRKGYSVESTSLTSLEEYLSAPEDVRKFLVPIRIDYIGEQLIIGLRKVREPIEGVGNAIANSVTEGTEKALGIASPKVFMEIGRQLVAGRTVVWVVHRLRWGRRVWRNR